jgi:hypothetical protein
MTHNPPTRLMEAARQMAAEVAKPILRDMLSMSRGQFAEHLEEAFEAGARWGIEAAAEAVEAQADRGNGDVDVTAHNLAIDIRALAQPGEAKP